MLRLLFEDIFLETLETYAKNETTLGSSGGGYTVRLAVSWSNSTGTFTQPCHFLNCGLLVTVNTMNVDCGH